MERPNSAAEPRHRKPGPARVHGPDGVLGKRAREVDEIDAVEEPAAAEA